MAAVTVKRYIAVDLGKESGSVVLTTVTDGIPVQESLYTFPMHVTRMAGKNFWNIYSIFDEVLTGLAAAGAKKLQIESLGVTSWTSDYVCVAGDGSFIGLPLASRGSLPASLKEKFFKKLSASDYYSITASQIRDNGTAFQLFARSKEKNMALENAGQLLFISDAIIYLLTGKKICERTQLSSAGLMNVKNGKVARPVLKLSHVRPKRFHPVVASGTKVSRLTEEIGEITGLGRLNVIAVAGSSSASAVSVLPFEEEGSAYLYVGKEAFIGIETSAPVMNGRMLELNISNVRISESKYLILKEMPGMEILSSCLAHWKKDGKAYSEEDIRQMLASSLPSKAMIDLSDSVLTMQKDMPAAISRYCTSKEMQAPVDDSSTLRLIYESFAAQCGDLFRKFQGISPFRLKSLYVFGPYAEDGFLNGLLAGECSVPVVAVPGELSALGNSASQAGLGRKNLSDTFVTHTIKPRTY